MCESELELFLKEIQKSHFFSAKEKTMIQKRDERKKLIIGMVLLNERYCNWAEEKDCNMQKNTLRSAIEYLENAFPEGGDSINAEDIPTLIYLADVAEYKEIEPEAFREWWFALEKDKKQGSRKPPRA